MSITSNLISGFIAKIGYSAAAAKEQLIEPNGFTIAFTVVFIIISIAVGIYATKKAKTAEQFFGGTKSFGPMVVALSSASAIMSAFGFIGGPGYVYKFGFTSVWMTFAAGTGFGYAYWLLGKRMRGMAEVTDVATLPDIAKVRYRSQAVRGLLAAALFIASIAYLSSQVKGGAKLVVQMIGCSENIAVLILFGTTLIYMLFSGMSGSILTDAFQGLVMVVGVFGVLFGFFYLTKGDAMTTIQSYSKFGPAFVDGAGKLPFHYIIPFTIVFFIGVLGQPQMLTKMYSLKSHKDLKKAGFLSGLTYALTSLVWFLVGYGALYIVASGQHTGLQAADNAAFLFLSKMNGLIQALVMAALLAAIMSTASFFVSIASGAITRDLLGSFGKEIPHEKQIHWGRILTVVVTLFAVGFGYWGGRAVLVLGALGWGFFCSATIPTFLLGLFWKRATKEGAIAGLIVAVISNLGFIILKNLGIFSLPFPDYLFSIGVSVFVTVMVSLVTKTAGGDDLPEEIKPIFNL
jgi:SSS family transporter